MCWLCKFRSVNKRSLHVLNFFYFILVELCFFVVKSFIDIYFLVTIFTLGKMWTLSLCEVSLRCYRKVSVGELIISIKMHVHECFKYNRF